MKIVIAGKNNIAVKAVEFIKLNFSHLEIFGCITRTDDFKDSWQQSLGKYCIDNDIKILSLQECYGLSQSIFFSLEFDRIIDPNKFSHKNVFNIHFSLLPSYKGMFTSVLPLLRGEKNSGVTLHKIDEGIDTGDIIDQEKFDLSLEINAENLYYKFIEIGFKLFKKNFENLLNGSYTALPQSPINSTYYSKKQLDFSNISIDLQRTAFEIHNQVRAFCFRPYQLPEVVGEKIYKSLITNDRSAAKAGTIIFQDKFQIVLSTIDYNIILYIDQQEYLFAAAADGDLQSIKKLQQETYPLSTKNFMGWNALIVAAYHNNIECFKFLLDSGLSLDSCNYNGTTVPMYAMTSASRTDDLTLLDYVLSFSPNLRTLDAAGNDIFYYASKYENSNVINKLKEYK